ncbi:MAG: hypothetical protein AAGM22_15275, partial [Acidobacteriota bacterium]
MNVAVKALGVVLVLCLTMGAGASAGTLETLTLPAPAPGQGIYYGDVQAAFPGVNWNTLDRLYLP